MNFIIYVGALTFDFLKLILNCCTALFCNREHKGEVKITVDQEVDNYSVDLIDLDAPVLTPTCLARKFHK